ncbi:hypothetical protein GY21_01720 [Cryobacterium roopkundense]|uniref:Lipoprotein n=1 Tax=Cryobacterium roopkundense TaxID=1001240 RepID=A0A099JRV3_9MICO|nr:hypothetical protein [Cryobacterium roopkundense]KGJ81109.1 hypothetical protein GY21_01720 [Cryobacterium roopkundense]MBB5641898.1 hypothetical protein [Cryobacterium roopkundense]
MTTSPRVRTVTLALIAALGFVPLLAGCDAVGGAVNTAVTDATGGNVSLGGQLPAGWPSEVPVIDGTILFGAGTSTSDKQGWVVTIDATSTDPLADARTQLEGAGFVADKSASSESSGVVAMKNDTYRVVVVANSDGILYTVTPL